MIAMLLLVAVGLFTLTGCGGSSGSGDSSGSAEGGGSDAPAEDKPVTLMLGFQANTSSSEYKAAELLRRKPQSTPTAASPWNSIPAASWVTTGP